MNFVQKDQQRGQGKGTQAAAATKQTTDRLIETTQNTYREAAGVLCGACGIHQHISL